MIAAVFAGSRNNSCNRTVVSASSIINLGPAAFRSLLSAVQSALKPHAHANPPPPAACCNDKPCDEGNRRIRLDEAQREIDRLRRQVDRVDLCSTATTTSYARPADGDPPRGLSADLASPTQRRRSYAVTAVGDIRDVVRISPLMVQSPHVNHVATVTNLGTRLDVLM